MQLFLRLAARAPCCHNVWSRDEFQCLRVQFLSHRTVLKYDVMDLQNNISEWPRSLPPPLPSPPPADTSWSGIRRPLFHRSCDTARALLLCLTKSKLRWGVGIKYRACTTGTIFLPQAAGPSSPNYRVRCSTNQDVSRNISTLTWKSLGYWTEGSVILHHFNFPHRATKWHSAGQSKDPPNTTKCVMCAALCERCWETRCCRTEGDESAAGLCPGMWPTAPALKQPYETKLLHRLISAGRLW